MIGAALADSVHQSKRIAQLEDASRKMLLENCLHWIASTEPLDSFQPRPGAPNPTRGCYNRSAGHTKHELTIGMRLHKLTPHTLHLF